MAPTSEKQERYGQDCRTWASAIIRTKIDGRGLNEYHGAIQEYQNLILEYHGTIQEYQNLILEYHGAIQEYQNLILEYHGTILEYQNLILEYPGAINEDHRVINFLPIFAMQQCYCAGGNQKTRSKFGIIGKERKRIP